MCFGGGGNKQSQPSPPPAPAPAPPAPVAIEDDIKAPRKAEDKANFGGSGVPNLRVDRSVSSGGVGAGGSGLRM